MSLETSLTDVPFPSSTNYRLRRDGFVCIPELRRYNVCVGYPHCKDQYMVKYLEHFLTTDTKHDHLITPSSYPSYGGAAYVRPPLHRKESSITPKQLLPSWTDYERRAYVDHFYVLSQQHRERYNTQNPYDACRIYEYFKMDETSPFSKGFTNEFFNMKPKYLTYKHPQLLPLKRRDDTPRDASGKWLFCHKKRDGP